MMHRKIAWLGMEAKSSQPRRNASRRSLYVMSRMIGCEGAAAEPVSTWVMSEPPELFIRAGRDGQAVPQRPAASRPTAKAYACKCGRAFTKSRMRKLFTSLWQFELGQ